MVHACPHNCWLVSLMHLAKSIVFSSALFFVDCQLVFNGAELLKIVFKVAFVLYVCRCEIRPDSFANVYLSVT